MLTILRRLVARWIGESPEVQARGEAPASNVPEFLLLHPDNRDDRPTSLIEGDPVPYDENLLERARTLWQFGDWESLARLDRDTLQHHPDRAKLALLAAAGRLQTGQDADAKQLIRLAQDWGAGKKLTSQILIAGVHNSIGRAAAIGNQQQRALQHFENAIAVGTPGSDARLLTQARIAEQLDQLGLPESCAVLKASAGGTTMPEPKLLPLGKRIESLTAIHKQQQAGSDTRFKAQADEFIMQARDAKRNEPEAEKKVTAKPQAKPAGRDDDIDELIEDLSLFFQGRFIVYVDVGAYVGAVFKRLFDSKKVKIREAHLFEPNPESYAQLKRAVEGIHSMHAHNLAIGKGNGIVKMISSKTMTKVIDEEDVQGLGNVFDARCVTLDSQHGLFTDGKINLLKIDVEGRELDVLEGAMHLLESQSVDMIYIEVGFNRQGTQQTYFGEIDAALQSLGYRVFRIYEQKNEWINDSPMLRRSNFAYMSQKFADANPSSIVRKMRAMEQELQQIKSGRAV